MAIITRQFQTVIDLALQYAGSIEASFEINHDITIKVSSDLELNEPRVINPNITSSYFQNEVYPATLKLVEDSFPISVLPDYTVGGGDVQLEVVPDDPYITGLDTLTATKLANTYFVDIYSNRAYQISSSVDWVNAVANNQFDSRVSVYISTNTTGQSRNGIVTLSAIDDSINKQILIVQNG